MKQIFITALLCTATYLVVYSQTSNRGAVRPSNSNIHHVQKSLLIIRKAVYGNLSDSTVTDVTDKVRAMVKDDSLNVLVSDEEFGDPYHGTRPLTVIKANLYASNLNFGGDDGGKDVTPTVSQFQNGNQLIAKINGPMHITVYYKYGDGDTLSTKSADDGMIKILPPSQLRVDYTINGVNMTKIASYNELLQIDNPK